MDLLKGFEKLWIWDNPNILRRLSWYYAVSLNKMPAKYLICERIPVGTDLKTSDEAALWKEFDDCTERFLELWRGVKEGKVSLNEIPRASPSLLDLTVELTQRMLTHCNFCRWNCRVNRSLGTKHGACMLEWSSRVSSYFHHTGEELVFRGTRGSGTIFFTSCNMRCAFCIHPNTFIVTQRGPVPIAQLYEQAGFEKEYNGGCARFPEDVITVSSDGRPVKVTKIFRHDYRGDLILIEPLYAPPIMVTPEHEIPACSDPGSGLVKVAAGELSRGHWLAIPKPMLAARAPGELDLGAIISPVAAEFMYLATAQHGMPNIQQLVALPQAGAKSHQIAAQLGYHPAYMRSPLARVKRGYIPEPVRQNSLIVEAGKTLLKSEKRPGIPTRLKVTEELAEFLGYYCSEGFITKSAKRPSSYRVVISFRRHEGDLASRSAELIWRLFGVRPHIVKRKTTITVEVGKSSLALSLLALCGSNAATKRVPEPLFQASPSIVEAFLKAFSACDGSLTGGHLSYNTVSERLAMGLYGLSLLLGHLPNFNFHGPLKEKLIEGRRVAQPTLYYVKVRADRMKEGSRRNAKRVRYRFKDNHILVPIYRVSRVPYAGPVYNIEVDDPEHTYAANFVAIGNCQNGDISTDKDNGIPVTPQQLAAMAWELRMEGCHNINWVGGEPTIHLHNIVKAISLLSRLRPEPDDLAYIEMAKSDFRVYGWDKANAYYEGEFNAPMLWNSNFFMSDYTMRVLRVLIDVWLPDLKFGNDRCAIRLSRTPWYWETVTKNHLSIYRWGEDFVIRHLIMPNHVECCTKPILDWIADNMPDALVNVMPQYHPDNYADPRSPKYDPKYAEIARYPTKEEIAESYRYARELGLNFEAITFEKYPGLFNALCAGA